MIHWSWIQRRWETRACPHWWGTAGLEIPYCYRCGVYRWWLIGPPPGPGDVS